MRAMIVLDGYEVVTVAVVNDDQVEEASRRLNAACKQDSGYLVRTARVDTLDEAEDYLGMEEN